VWERARRETLAKTGGHYPAPLVALAVMRDGLALPLPRALEVEAGAFAELAVAEPAKSLISIFFAKNEVEARAGRIAKGAREVGAAAVLGAGFMGAGIAGVLAEKGVRVVLKDRDLAAAGRGLAACRARFEELAERRKLSEPEVKTALARIRATDSYDGLAGVDLAIEAVFEDLELKRRVLAEVEAAARADLVFASNTSAIPIGSIAEASGRPENVVGMHFFSPVHRMPLLEVIRQPKTSQEALATVVAAGRRMGKAVIVVNDGPGFFTTRVLAPYLNEAAWLLSEGVPIERIDEAAVAWGWPVGPFALLDEVGLDVAAHAGQVMRQGLGERLDPPPVFASLLAQGRAGRKGGRGFYLYGEEQGRRAPRGDHGNRGRSGKRVDPAVYELLGWRRSEAQPTHEEIADRLFLQMLGESARCLEEGIVAEPADVDIGTVFGFGFPPFRGGLLREADRQGLGPIVERLERYAERLGPRFEPAPLLRDLAARGGGFHGKPA
jgi:3-hydroxyacyl-CoA dehydrogenase / enoyl-CoA hydratase / 3-hydroxybutyryl-CoA epimerase